MNPGEIRKLLDQSKAARALANELFNGPCDDVRDGNPCLKREEYRKPRRGQTRRGFAQYNPFNLCLPCGCYWFAERAAQELHRLYCIAVRTEARTEAAAVKP